MRYWVFLFISSICLGQDYSLNGFLDHVKQHHPFVKQAALVQQQSEAKLQKTRGALDPRLEGGSREKSLDGTNYYTAESYALSVPTPFGVTMKAEVDNAAGAYLNPEGSTGNDRLYAVGGELDLGKGLVFNDRGVALQQAKDFVKQTRAENQLQINAILLSATTAFTAWYQAYEINQIYTEYLANAAFRFQGVQQRYQTGDLAAIDTIEAKIALNNRKLLVESARLQLAKKQLELANFLWSEDASSPFLQEWRPILQGAKFISAIVDIDQHPKIRSIQYKAAQLRAQKRLTINNMLPEMVLDYALISPNTSSFDPVNSVAKMKFDIPLFLRKERGDLKLSKLKLEEVTLELKYEKTALQNKIQALETETDQAEKLLAIAQGNVLNLKAMYEGEDAKFNAGESSLFLVNTRESKWIEGRVKALVLAVKLFNAQATLYYTTTFPTLN